MAWYYTIAGGIGILMGIYYLLNIMTELKDKQGDWQNRVFAANKEKDNRKKIYAAKPQSATAWQERIKDWRK